jgi:hypothetical protein
MKKFIVAFFLVLVSVGLWSQDLGSICLTALSYIGKPLPKEADSNGLITGSGTSDYREADRLMVKNGIVDYVGFYVFSENRATLNNTLSLLRRQTASEGFISFGQEDDPTFGRYLNYYHY